MVIVSEGVLHAVKVEHVLFNILHYIHLTKKIYFNTDNEIDTEAGITLCEAIKSNSSLTTLDLLGNILVA
jgi:hypothetical protein